MSWDGGKNVQTRAELEEAEQCTCGHTRVAHEDNVGFCWDCDAWVSAACCQKFVKRTLKDGPVAPLMTPAASVRRWTVQSLPRVDLARPEQQLTGGIILSGPEVSSGTEVVDAVAYDALAVWAWELAEMLHRREVARGYAESVHSDPFDQCGARLCRETRSQCEAT